MGLIIELSFDICKNASITSIKQLLSNIAEKHNSKTNYFMHEIQGHSTTIERNECINVVEFEETDKVNIIRYIKDIIKIKFIKIDCIYEEKGVVNLIYNGRNNILPYPNIQNCKPNKIKPINDISCHKSKKNILELVKLWESEDFSH